MDLLSFVFPRTCPICGKPTGILFQNKQICDTCKKKLFYIKEPRCKKCGKQLLNEQQEYCFDCEKVKHLYKCGVAAFTHCGPVMDSIYKIKYNNKREYVDFYTTQIVKQYGDYIKSWNCDELIPVPIYKKKMKKRGYNQAEVIAKSLSKKLHIPINKLGMIRVKNTLPQKNFNNIERCKNLESAFKIGKKDVKLKKMILVDDIYTTGSTIDACSKVLLEAGAKEVYFICLTIGTGYS